jgi:hypothetical protein
MVSLILTLIIIIGTVAHFYLKFTPMKSFVTFINTTLGFVVAFSYYELLAGLLISKGYISHIAQSLSFLVIFAVVSVMLKVLTDFIVGSNIDFGQATKITTDIIFGVLTGLIISGAVTIALGLAPFRKSVPYARFGDTINAQNPSSAMIPADGFITGFYNIISKSALGTGNRFDVVHAKFLDQIHLNRFAVKDEVSIVAAEKAAFVEKFGVRKKELPGGDVRTVIELSIKNKSIEDGGALDSANKLSFALAQTRLICAPADQLEVSGSNIGVLYPEKYLIKGQPVKNDVQLSEIITFDRKSIKGKAARIDLAFMVPENLTPKFLQFKSNTLIKLPKLATQEDIDAAAEEAANNPVEQ